MTATASRRGFLGGIGGVGLTIGLRASIARPRAVLGAQSSELPANYVAGSLIHLSDNGAWSWFTDERAIVHDGKLIVGSVRATSTYKDDSDPNWGNIEVSVLDLASGLTGRTVLHHHLEQDDHNSPSFLPLPDGSLLAFYAKHRVERRLYTRISEPGNPLAWGPTQVIETPGTDVAERPGNNVTYSNLFQLPSGIILNLYRGYQGDPNILYSDDVGRTWHHAGRLLHGKGGYAPYLKYASDGRGTIYFVANEDHPWSYNNSVYAGKFRNGELLLSDGTRLGAITGTLDATIAAWDFTRVFAGDADHVAWVNDLELDAANNPCVVFSVQRDGAAFFGQTSGKAGFDLRYYYGRYDGTNWSAQEIAYAGTRLYPLEEDYSGLATLDPSDPSVVYISTDADPTSGEPLMSSADGQRHHELYRGTTMKIGEPWTWEPLTANSTVDNLRPIVPKWSDPRTALVWMRGRYENNFGPWSTDVVAMILPGRDTSAMSAIE